LEGGSSASTKTIVTLATAELRKIQDKITKALEKGNGRLDTYTVAHLSECKQRIGKALEAQYIYNAGGIGGFGFPGGVFIQPTEGQPADPYGGSHNDPLR